MTTRLFSIVARTATIWLAVPFLAATAWPSGVAAEPAAQSELSPNHFSSMHPVVMPGISIPNFGVVDGHIYRGEQPARKDYAALAAIGVKTIIDLRDDAKVTARHDAQSAGLKYINIGIYVHGSPTDAQALAFLKDLNDPANGVIYVHCAGGMHRTGAMIAIYRMVHDGWNASQAYTEMLAYGFYSFWGHEGFKKYVDDYYQRMTANPSSVPMAYKPAASGN